MSNVDDLRKLFQDLIAPKLRALSVRVESLEKHIDDRFKATDQRIEALDRRLDDNLKGVSQNIETLERHTGQRIETLERQTGERFADLNKRLDADHARSMLAITQLSDYYGLAKRVTAIEERGTVPEPRADH
jgi:exonuclease VII large subunit